MRRNLKHCARSHVTPFPTPASAPAPILITPPPHLGEKKIHDRCDSVQSLKKRAKRSVAPLCCNAQMADLPTYRELAFLYFSHHPLTI